MTQIAKALIWAAAIILFAIASASGLVESETARTMMIVLPILAWAAIGGKSCLPRRAGGVKGKS